MDGVGSWDFTSRTSLTPISSLLTPFQPSVLAVGKYIDDVTCSLPLLHVTPEFEAEEIFVAVQEGFSQWPGKRHHRAKLLRKHVPLTHGEPGFSRHLLLQGGGMRQQAKIAIGQQAELVVIVEDHPSMAGDAKVFQE